MINPFNRQPKRLDDMIDRVSTQMIEYGPEASEYANLLATLERLNEMKTKDRRNPISWDTLALVGGNLAGIFVIVIVERTDVFTSQAVKQLLKPR